jgi:anthranilate/para-aminobenzoate synthase component II
MTLLIDNYDSFTHNLYQFLEQLGANVRVVRNDQITIEQIEVRSPSVLFPLLYPVPYLPRMRPEDDSRELSFRFFLSSFFVMCCWVDVS